MKSTLILIVLLLARLTALQAAPPWPKQLPVYDHIVIVFEENKDYEQVIGNKASPYINGTLKAEGADLTKMFGEEHYSEGNYFWLLSGSNQNIGYVDAIPSQKTSPRYPFLRRTWPNNSSNMGSRSKAIRKICRPLGIPSGRKGITPASMSRGSVLGTSPMEKLGTILAHLRFADFPEDFAKLPTISVVIPNLIHDMHDGRPPKSVADGDAWLKQHLDGYYQWAKSHNSLLIVTFDENDDTTSYAGPTNPASRDKVIQNRIPTIIAGAYVKHGEYPEKNGVTHVNILRTLEAMYKLQKCGAQLPSAVNAGIADETVITDIFDPSP